MANYPQERAKDVVCQSHTGHMTGLWFLPTRPLRLNTNERMNTDIERSYGLSSDHSPVISTISTSPINMQHIPRLHNSRTNWSTYRTTLHDTINFHVSLKSSTEIEEATNNFISLLQQAAQKATPTVVYKKDIVNIPLEIKKLLAKERKGKQEQNGKRSRTPSDKTSFNRPSSFLKSQLKVMRTNLFKNHVSTLSRYDNFMWKLIKSLRKPTLAISSSTLGVTESRKTGEKATKKKQQYSRNTSRTCSTRVSRNLTKKCFNSWDHQPNQLKP